MLTRRTKNELKNLPLSDKIIGVAILFMSISVFFPWYQETDPWGGNPEQYLGISGPLYLIGWVILLISGYLLNIFLFYALKKENPKIALKIDLNLQYLIGAVIVLFFNLLNYSIYFHQKFGVNPLRKELRVGMILAFFGASTLVIASYIKYRQEFRLNKPYLSEAENLNKPVPTSSDNLPRQSHHSIKTQNNAQNEETQKKEEKKVINLRMDI